MISSSESQGNCDKDDVNCAPFKGSAGVSKDIPEGKNSGSRRCEKAWEQDLVSVGAAVLNLRGGWRFHQGPNPGCSGCLMLGCLDQSL